MCDATGFSFVLSDVNSGSDASSRTQQGLMGDEIKFGEKQNLVAHLPVNCHTRLLRNGSVIKESPGNEFEHMAEGPGVYRLEAWLMIDGEKRPWIYSNPIYLR